MTVRQELLRPASFRGVDFHVEESGLEFGRRVQVHQYPQRDRAWPEDLGRAPRAITFTAFVVGDDYIQRAERLMAALETKGGGTLVHPEHGTMQATAGIQRVRYRRDSLGYAAFELSFTEAGDLIFPSAQVATQAASRIAADGLVTAAEDDFTASFSVDGVPDFVVDGASADLRSMLKVLSVQAPGLEALGLAEKVGAAADDIASAIESPPTLARLITACLALTDLSDSAARWGVVVQSLVRLAASAGLSRPAAPVVVTPSRQQAWANTEAINALARNTLLAQAVGVSSLLSPTVYDDVLTVRNGLDAAIEAEGLVAGDSMYRPLQAARGAAWKDLTTRARGAARLRSYTPPAPMPALVVAYAVHGDATREAEIVERNHIRHPGFVPAQVLQVLSR